MCHDLATGLDGVYIRVFLAAHEYNQRAQKFPEPVFQTRLLFCSTDALSLHTTLIVTPPRQVTGGSLTHSTRYIPSHSPSPYNRDIPACTHPTWVPAGTAAARAPFRLLDYSHPSDRRRCSILPRRFRSRLARKHSCTDQRR